MDLKKLFCLSMASRLSVLCFAQNMNSMPEILLATSVHFTISTPIGEKVEINGSMLQPMYKVKTKIATIGSGTKNGQIVRDIADTLNYFIIPGGVGDYYLDKKVPNFQ